MKLNRYLLFTMLSVFLLVFTGCGKDRTEYETATSGDTTPATFAFTNMTGVQLGATVTSNSITVSGITAAAPISVTGGSYSIGTGDFTSSAGTVTNGQTVRVQQTASTSNGTATTTTLTIGGVSATFTSKTIAIGGGTTTPTTGAALFAADCSSCHATASALKSYATLAQLKAANMASYAGNDDTVLQKIADYLATL